MDDIKWTGLFDENNVCICVGDILTCDDGYRVLVCEDENGFFYGTLICDLKDSCRNIPYALNYGKGYHVLTLLYKQKGVTCLVK